MNTYIFFKKIHRYLVLVTFFSSLLMMISGAIIKFPSLANVFSIDLVFMRSLHNLASPLFSFILLLMSVSGTVMYFYPLLRRKTNA